MISNNLIRIKKAVSHSNLPTKAYVLKLRRFKQKIYVHLERRRFLVKTVENYSEFKQALGLRYEVFNKELLLKNSLIHLDIDKYDMNCDHLIVIDKSVNKVIGGYRLISSLFSDNFYSENEFYIDSFKKLNDVKLELGRACVHKDYRNAATITLLWMGLMEYFRKTGAKYFFGCSSVPTTNFLEVSLILKYFLDQNYLSETFDIKPKSAYEIKELDNYLPVLNRLDVSNDYAERIVPPLLKSYIKAGSYVCGEPAYDKDFRCVDFFTVLDTELLNKNYGKKFGTPAELD